jgi:hypothetical protein
LVRECSRLDGELDLFRRLALLLHSCPLPLPAGAIVLLFRLTSQC